MKNDSIYENIVISKTNEEIICFNNGKSMFSTYNPHKDAQKFVESLEIIEDSFLITTGMGEAYHIYEILNKNPNLNILIIEKYYNDFYKFNDIYEDLKKNKNIIFTDICNLSQNIINNFFPQRYSKLIYKPLRSWIDYNYDLIDKINDTIEITLKKIKSDFSVQSYFGKRWIKNFFGNLYSMHYSPSNFINFNQIKFPTEKKALIVAAGPSLDKNIELIKHNQKNFFIIAVDTAYQVLLKNKIFSDVLVSIDCQYLSAKHVIDKMNPKTLIVADFTSNTSLIEKSIKNGNSICLFSNNNPICNYAKTFFNKKLNNEIFLTLDSTSGTVTNSAVDFALKANFSHIFMVGADFSYINGKAYARGTYLENIYFQHENKLNNAETSFDALMFRTELIKLDDKNNYTTETLSNYKNGLNSIINKYPQIKFDKIENFNNNINTSSTIIIDKEKKYFFKYLLKDFLINIQENIKTNEENELVFPLYAYIKRIKPFIDKKNLIKTSNNLAKKIIAFYTKIL